MVDKICSFCRESYVFADGHDYDRCVKECEEKLSVAVRILSRRYWALNCAKEIQGQDWWRSKKGWSKKED